MSDRDRLAWLVKNALAAYGAEADSSKKPQDFMADFLLSSGVIVPPCKVGDDVYFVVEYDGEYFIDEGEVASICKDGGAIWVSAHYESGLRYYHKAREIGKTVFLTREEAEQALKERKEK